MDGIGASPNLIGNGVERFLETDSLKSTRAEQMESKAESVGKEFEGVFMSLVLKEMRNTLEGGGFFGEESSDTYGGLFDMFIGQSMAESGPLGIADMLMESYKKNQGPAVGAAEEATAEVVRQDFAA